MSRLRPALIVALTLSIGANIYLFVSRSSAREAAGTAPTTEHQRPPVPPTPPPRPHATSTLDRLALEQRLLAGQTELERLLPASEKWVRGLRSAPNEEKLRPYFTTLFGTSDPAAYDLECRDDMCKLTVQATGSAAPDWLAAIQSDPEALRLLQFRSVSHNIAYVEIRDPARGAMVALAAAVSAAFLRSSAIEDCKHADPAPGEMTVMIALDTVGRRWRITTTGPLAHEHVGLCIQAAVERVLAEIPIPTDVGSFPDLDLPVRIP